MFVNYDERFKSVISFSLLTLTEAATNISLIGDAFSVRVGLVGPAIN